MTINADAQVMAVWELGFAAGHVSKGIVSEVVAIWHHHSWILVAGILTWRPDEWSV